MIKRICAILFAVVVLCGLSLAAIAHEVPQDREDCTITVLVRYDGETVSGGSLTAVRVGYVAERDGDYFFRRVFDDLRIFNVGTPSTVTTLNRYYNNNKDDQEFKTQKVTITEGEAVFTDLSTGLYLIIQEEASSGYSKLNPFLVSVPYYEDGKYNYDVTAAIKSELEREPETTVATTTPGGKLPQTGQLNWPVPVLAAAGLALIVIGMITRKEKEKS